MGTSQHTMLNTQVCWKTFHCMQRIILDPTLTSNKHSFKIVAAFVSKLHGKRKIHLGAPKKRNSEGITIIATERSNNAIDKLKSIMNNKKQFICFLTGAGGTGKSQVNITARNYVRHSMLTVSYTHLTLPTILLV